MSTTTPPADPLGELDKLARRLARLERTRGQLTDARNQLIREVMATDQAGATVIARASRISTAAVYKIRDRAPGSTTNREDQ
jgi:hypothetical protein